MAVEVPANIYKDKQRLVNVNRIFDHKICHR